MIEGWKLTTDHPTSSYGMPVFVYDGVGYGPRDRISSFRVADLVVDWAREDGRSGEDVAMAKKFLSVWPDGPQV